MAGTMKTCVECGDEFELKPNKPGCANRCPGCSPSAPLPPAEARQAALERKGQLADDLFQKTIAEKRTAERLGQRGKADDLEQEIQKLDKARIKPRPRREPSEK